MTYARAAVLTGREIDESDIAAYWLKSSYASGQEWIKVWTNPTGAIASLPLGGRYTIVERMMVEFRERCERLVARQPWTDTSLGWCRTKSLTAQRSPSTVKPKRFANAT